MYSNVFITCELSSSRQQHDELKPRRATAVSPCYTAVARRLKQASVIDEFMCWGKEQ